MGEKNWRRNKRERYQSDSHRKDPVSWHPWADLKVNLSGKQVICFFALSHLMGQCLQSVDSGSKEEEFNPPASSRKALELAENEESPICGWGRKKMYELRIRDQEDTGHYHSRYKYYCCSVTKRCPTLCPYGLQHARFLCPSLSPGVCSNSCPDTNMWRWLLWRNGFHCSGCQHLFRCSGAMYWVGQKVCLDLLLDVTENLTRLLDQPNTFQNIMLFLDTRRNEILFQLTKSENS